MAYKFSECRKCLFKNEEDTCEECDSGELFEERDELELNFDREVEREWR